MLHAYARNYLLHGLGATPDVLDALLKDAATEDFDRRPDPERFTIREAVAHMADFELVWLERSTRSLNEERPELPDRDEGKMAIENDYAHTDVREQQALFRKRRGEFLEHLKGLPLEAWDRIGVRYWGEISIEQQAVLVLGHDGYHTKQVVEWLKGQV